MKTGEIKSWEEVEVGDKIRKLHYASGEFCTVKYKGKYNIICETNLGGEIVANVISDACEEIEYYQEPEEKKYRWIVKGAQFSFKIEHFLTLSEVKAEWVEYKILNRCEEQPKPNWEG